MKLVPDLWGDQKLQLGYDAFKAEAACSLDIILEELYPPPPEPEPVVEE